MCAVCEKTLSSLVDHECFDDESMYIFALLSCVLIMLQAFVYRDDEHFLKYAFRARNEDQETRDEIAEEQGIRWSVLDMLPNWKPAWSTPPDFMHAAYLG